MLKIRRINYIELTIIIYVCCAVASDDGSYIMKCARLLLFGVCGLNVLFGNKLKVNQHILWLIGFLSVAVLSILWAERAAFSISMAKTLIFNAICMCALANLVDNRRDRIELILKCMICAPILLEIRVILKAGILAFLDTRSIGGISANIVGLCAGFGATYAVYYYLNREKNRKYLLLAAVNCLIVILSCSKKALLSIMIPFGMVYVLNTRDNQMKRIGKCVALVIAGGFGLWAVLNVPVLYNVIGHRIEGVLAFLGGNMEGVDGSTEARASLIAKGMVWFRERPWLGYGIDNYRAVLVKNFPDWPIEYYAHNNYVELLVDVGILGLAVYYCQYICLFYRCINNKEKSNADVMISSMIVTLAVIDYALVSYYDKYVQLLLLTLWFTVTRLLDNSCEMKSEGEKRW